MNLIFVTEARFVRDSEGRIYSNSSFDNTLWSRYLEVFDQIHVVARIKNCEMYEGDMVWLPKIQGVDFIDFMYFVGVKDYLVKRNLLIYQAKRIVSEFKNDKFLCRIPGNLGNLIINELIKINKPYSVEVVGDPWDVFAPGSVKHFFRPFIRYKARFDLKRNVKKSFATLYVTKESLQKRYPSVDAKFIVNASDVCLTASDYAEKSKTNFEKNSFNLISIGSLDQMYKSPDVMLNAIKQLRDKGINCKLVWLGSGKYLESMKNLAIELGIFEYVDFKGNVDRSVLRRELFQSDLFILASRTEGLPRSVIEAMAAGLPCIATDVGGIPELLDNSALVQKNDFHGLALKIEEFLKNPFIYNFQASRNLEEAQIYKDEILAQKRNQFYRFILENQ